MSESQAQISAVFLRISTLEMLIGSDSIQMFTLSKTKVAQSGFAM